MQRNFILTDVMKTGFHVDLEDYIHMNTFTDQTFDMTGEYYTLHNFDLDAYDRRFAIIDYNYSNKRLENNAEFLNELHKRCQLLHSQGFKFIKATPWESLDNVLNSQCYPEYDIEHVKWTGGVSWFWYGIPCYTTGLSCSGNLPENPFYVTGSQRIHIRSLVNECVASRCWKPCPSNNGHS